jgi:hypothetical protein
VTDGWRTFHFQSTSWVAFDKREGVVKRHFSAALLRGTAIPEWLRTETPELSR